jgi:predicted amidohydrolase YtcJ
MKEEASMTAELVFINGNIITVDQDFSIQEAVAIAAGKIVAVGTTDAINAHVGAATRVIDLDGKTLLPGINEPHLHAPFFGATRPPLALDLTPQSVRSIEDMKALLAEKVKTSKPGEWIRGYGWDQGALAECQQDPQRLPRKWDLDAVAPDNPVAFTDFSAHNLLVNSKLLEIAGITKATPDPASGKMERDPQTGEPTGIFVELGAQSLVTPSIPLLTREEKKLALKTALEHFSRNGVTSFTDAAIGPGGEKAAYGVMSAEFVDIYKELLDSGQLTARATILLLLGDYGALTLADLQRHMEAFEIPGGIDTTWLNLPGVKIFADGIPPSMTAWMNADYVGGGRGSLVIPGETDEAKCASLKSMINYVHSKGRQIGVHATGDAAIDATVDAFAEAAEQYGNDDLRHYVVHGDFISRQKAETLARYGFGLAMQPSIKAMIADFAPAFLGPERAAYQMPMAMAMDAGVVVTSSSDAPVTYPNWRKGIQAAVQRKGTISGNVSGADQCISVEQAIRTYTINGAWQDKMEHLKGSIETGKLADMCIIDQDIINVDPDTIGDIKVLMTVVGGKIVYDTLG